MLLQQGPTLHWVHWTHEMTIAGVLKLPPDLLLVMLFVWVIVVGASLIVYQDARRHHIGPAPGQVAVTPGVIAALMLWFNLWTLAVYMVKRKKLIERAAGHPSNKSGLITYVVWLVLYTAVFPIIALI